MGFANTSFKILKISDRDLVRKLIRFVDESPLPVKHAQIEYAGGGPATSLGLKDSPVDVEAFTSEISENLVSRIAVTLERSSLTITRPDGSLHDDLHLDLLQSNAQSHAPEADFEPIRATIRLAKGLFNAIDPAALAAPSDLPEHYAKRESELARLQGIVENSIRVLHEQSLQIQREYEDQYTARRQSLDAQAQADATRRGEDYDRRIELLANEFDAKDVQLAEREKNLAAREKEIDDADNRIARRRIRKELKEAIKARSINFALTAGTRGLRWVVHVFSALLLIVFATASIVTGIELASLVTGDGSLTVSVFVMSGVRQLFFAGAFTATAVFYLRWNSMWFQQNAEEEFRLKQLDLDFDRASWVVEMALEWKDEGGADLPPELLSRLTTGLFSRSSEKDQILHPADQLAAALLGSSAEIELDFPKGIGRARLDRKGIQKLQKPAGG